MKFDFLSKVKGFSKSIIKWQNLSFFEQSVYVAKSTLKHLFWGLEGAKIFSRRWRWWASEVFVYKKAPSWLFAPGALSKHEKAVFFSKRFWNQEGFYLKMTDAFEFFIWISVFGAEVHAYICFLCVNNVQNILRKSKSTKAPLMEPFKYIETFNFRYSIGWRL